MQRPEIPAVLVEHPGRPLRVAGPYEPHGQTIDPAAEGVSPLARRPDAFLAAQPTMQSAKDGPQMLASCILHPLIMR